MIWRVKLVSFFFLFIFLLIIVRLFWWQIIKSGEITIRGFSQYTRTSTLWPERGEIRTQDNFPLVSNDLNFLLFANPREIKDKNITTQLLAPLLEIETASVSARLSQDLSWVSIKNRIDKTTKEKIESLKLSGFGFERQYFRFYPESSMAAHLVGFVGKKEDGEDIGYFGLEGYYDRELRGRPGKIREVRDAQNRPILIASRSIEERVDGQGLVLNIDRRIQFIVEEKLKEGIERYQAKGGTVVVMDPKTGGILASSSFPSYISAKYESTDSAYFKDPFISDNWEPGSIFKPLIMAAALNENVVSADTRCDSCRGPVTIVDYTIRNWNNKYFPDTTMTEVIEHSDNTGMVFVGRRLGLEKLYAYLEKFGIGQGTNIDLQGEAYLLLRPRDKWYPIDLATAAFGQGIAATPVQILTAISSIANGGKLMEPHVVSKIVASNGREVVIRPKVVREVVAPETTKIITEMMVNSVEKGEARWAKPKGWRIAGKTGTSQIPIAGHYDPNRTVASFVGFAPADDPKFAMIVKINEPTTSVYGSETAAPIFFKIAKELLIYYNIPPKE